VDVANPNADFEHYGRFIPLTRQTVIADLCRDPDNRIGDGDGGDGRGRADDFARLAVKLQAYRNRQYRAVAEEMRRCYLPFSPDRDTISALPFTPDEKRRMEASLVRQIDGLLERANYEVLDEADINDIINKYEPHSLRVSVDLAEFERLRLYYRDEYTETFTYRRPEWVYLKKTTSELASFRRLFLLLKLKSAEDQIEALMKAKNMWRWRAERIVRAQRSYLPKGTSSEFIYLKVFKNLPKHDIQILFPNRKVAFRPFDKIKFGVTAGGGTAMGIFTTATKIAATTSPFTIVAAMLAFIGVVSRQVVSFFNHRTRYMMELSQKLFFHSLANNRAALTLLLDRAEEEDVKEDLITLYFFAGEEIAEADIPQRRRHIEEVFRTRYNVGVDFDIHDCLSRLERDGVVTRPADGMLRFPSYAQAAAHYDRKWRESDEVDIRHVCDPPPPDEVQDA
jgi:hypothetical protein